MLIAAISGATWALHFQRDGYLLSPLLALIPLILLLRHPRAALLGWVHGLFFWGVGLSWMVDTLVTYGGLGSWLSVGLTVLLALYLGAYTFVFGALGRLLWRGPDWLGLVGWPALWVTLEWVRGWLISGFPWNLAGYSLVDTPGALRGAAWVGASGLSALVVLAASGLALGVARKRLAPAALGVLIPAAILGLGALAPTGSDAGAVRLPVRVIQPNLSILEEWDDAIILDRYQRLMLLSQSACDVEGALVVWPESAPWPFVFERDSALARDLNGLAAQGCGVLFNSAHFQGERIYNSAFLLGSKGVVGRYDKRHLVPFGEYVPFQKLFPFVARLARAAGDLSAADELRLLPWEGQSLGVAVCYEVVFSAEVGQAVREGATVLVTLTNDAWYGNTAAPWQHYRAARFRAAEYRRPMIRAALTGVSGIIAADGSVTAQLGVGEEGVLAAEISSGRGNTLYAAVGPFFPFVCLLGGLGTLLFAISSRRKGGAE